MLFTHFGVSGPLILDLSATIVSLLKDNREVRLFIDLKPGLTLDQIENKLLSEINKLNIGPMGLGGKATVLAVNIETFPTHIAGLPVVLNLSCHALRSATAVI